MKNGVAEGVASDPHGPTFDALLELTSMPTLICEHYDVMPILKQKLPHINVTDIEFLYIASPFKRLTESIFDTSIDED